MSISPAIHGKPSHLNLLNSSRWAAVPDDLASRILCFDPDTARTLATVCREYRRISRDFIAWNLQQTFELCSTNNSIMCRQLALLGSSYQMNLRILREFKPFFVRGDLTFQFSAAEREHLQSRLSVTTYASVNQLLSALSGLGCLDEIMSPQQIVACRDQVQKKQDVSLRTLWKNIRDSIAERNPQSGDIPGEDAPTQQIRPWMHAHPACLQRINQLCLDRLYMGCLPVEIGLFTELEELYLRKNRLLHLPPSLFNGLTRLECLHLDYNRLCSLPPGLFGKLTSLKELYLNDNHLGTLPPGMLDGLTSLRGLHLEENKLRALPPHLLDEVTGLQSLELSGNPHLSLPPGLFNRLGRLQCLFIDQNQSGSLPSALVKQLNSQNGLILIEEMHRSTDQRMFDTRQFRSSFESKWNR